MKKLAIFFLIGIIIIAGISYLYLNGRIMHYEAEKENKHFSTFYQQEIYGTELVTILNKAVDNNERNEVLKNEKGRYLNNDLNSIEIKIKMLDNEKSYPMETIYDGGIDKFIHYYSEIKFKCVEIQYHTATNKVKYLLFEQITE